MQKKIGMLSADESHFRPCFPCFSYASVYTDQCESGRDLVPNSCLYTYRMASVVLWAAHTVSVSHSQSNESIESGQTHCIDRTLDLHTQELCCLLRLYFASVAILGTSMIPAQSTALQHSIVRERVCLPSSKRTNNE